MLEVLDHCFKLVRQSLSCSAAIERAPALGKVAILRLKDSRIFGVNRVTLEDRSVFRVNRVTWRGRKARCVSIPVKLATRLHPLARIPANSRVPADLGAIVPFSPIAAHRLHFATHSLSAERLTDKHQQQQGSKHGVHECSFGAPAGRVQRKNNRRIGYSETFTALMLFAYD
jgi:hypothetical protein